MKGESTIQNYQGLIDTIPYMRKVTIWKKIISMGQVKMIFQFVQFLLKSEGTADKLRHMQKKNVVILPNTKRLDSGMLVWKAIRNISPNGKPPSHK
jgi:hypothetical protein